ncbi:MAG: hypothetical protein ACR2NV_10145 [Thermoleophilaceae bacterium]
MRTFLLTAVLAVGLLLAPLAQADAGLGASVRTDECRSTDAPPSADFVAHMRLRGSARRMALRITLQERDSAGLWRSLRTGALSAWRHSRPGVRAFSYRQRVANLDPTRVYRVVARFRWIDADGDATRTEVHHSSECPSD